MVDVFYTFASNMFRLLLQIKPIIERVETLYITSKEENYVIINF